MNRIVELLIAVLIVLLLFVVVGLFLPRHGHVERSVEVGNPSTQIFDMINSFQRFEEWDPWVPLDPRAKRKVTGAESGVGAMYSWASYIPSIGTGNYKIVESVEGKSVKIAMENTWRGSEKTSKFKMVRDGKTKATTLTWVIDIDYGWNIFGRYAGLYLNGGVGTLMNEGLGKLATYLATVPIADYSQVAIEELQVESKNILYMSAALPAAPSKYQESFERQEIAFSNVVALMKRLKIEPAGSRMRIVTVLGDEFNDFNMAIPVESDEVEVTGNVRLGRSYGGAALMIVHTSHRMLMTRSRDMLKAYAMTHGYKFDTSLAGIFEEHISDYDEDSGAPSIVYLYLPVAKLHPSSMAQ